MNLFIDTNIFLAFYHFTSEDLEELKKLNVLLNQGAVQLFLPNQVIEEFRRNRENKIADAMRKLKEQRLNLQFPQLCKDYSSYMRLREIQKNYEKTHAELLDTLTQDINDQNLKADQIIKELFCSATGILSSKEIIERARLRAEIGNPPGKTGSVGDAINWEALLNAVPLQEPIYFITEDKDYCSPLDENRFDPFLLKEWLENKKSQLYFYNKLSIFFREKYPDIMLASEYEKENTIRELATSRSFAKTHNIIARLRKYSDFTLAQINDIVSICITNPQIYWIIGDTDVREFLTGIVQGNDERLESNNLQRMKECIAIYDRDRETAMPVKSVSTSDGGEELPF